MGTYVIVFAVVGLALTCASVAWRISALRVHVNRLALEQSISLKRFRSELERLAAQRPDSTPSAQLAVVVADLAAAVDELTTRHRKFAGKVWGRIGAAAEAEKPAGPLDRNELRRQHLPKPNGV
jgi:hypothetical protein